MITTHRERLKTNLTFYRKRGETFQREILCFPQERGKEPVPAFLTQRGNKNRFDTNQVPGRSFLRGPHRWTSPLPPRPAQTTSARCTAEPFCPVNAGPIHQQNLLNYRSVALQNPAYLAEKSRRVILRAAVCVVSRLQLKQRPRAPAGASSAES